jgi:hypothetical protein
MVCKADVVWSDDFDDGDYDNWAVQTGTWGAEEKYLTNTKLGSIYHPSSISVGTWSFDTYAYPVPSWDFSFFFMIDKPLHYPIQGSTEFYAYFISIYVFDDGSTSTIDLRRTAGLVSGTMETLVEYEVGRDLSHKWIHVDITRESDGRIKVYLNKELVIDYVDTLITESNYFLFLSEPGPAIDNIVVKDVVETPETYEWSEDFTDGNLDDWEIRGNWSATYKYAQVFYDPELGDHSNVYDDGRLRYPSQIAYGTWSFDLYIKDDKYILITFLRFGSSEEEKGHNDYYFEIKPTKQNSGFYLGRHVKSRTDLDYRLLAQKIVPRDLTEQWMHIDITRDRDGRIYIYRDGSLDLKVLNNENEISEWFGIYSDPDGAYIDNITVSNTVEVTHQSELEIIPDYNSEGVFQGEVLDLQILIRDDVRFPIEEAEVGVQVGDQSFDVSEVGDGVYQASIDTSSLEESFETIISAEKEGYIASSISYEIEISQDYGAYHVGWVTLKNISDTSGKQLRAKIFYPAKEPAENAEPIISESPYPTLIFVPGRGGSLEQATRLAQYVCRYGFCFISVGSRANANCFERSLDQIHAHNWITEQNTNSSFMLNEMFDVTRFGAIGYSDGGRGSIVSALNEPNFQALMIIDTGEERTDGNDIQIPILWFGGSRSNYGEIEILYEVCNSPKFLVKTDDSHFSVLKNELVYKYVAMFCKVYLSEDEDFIPYLYGEYAQQDIDDELIGLRYDISEGRTKFEVSNFVVEPDPVRVGDKMTFSMDVLNSGTKSGSYWIWFMIEQEGSRIVDEELWITLDPGSSEVVNFEFTPDEEGFYNFTANPSIRSSHLEGQFSFFADPSVKTNQQAGNFTVLEKPIVDPEPDPDEDTSNGGPIIPGFPVWSIGVSILIISLILRKKYFNLRF